MAANMFGAVRSFGDKNVHRSLVHYNRPELPLIQGVEMYFIAMAALLLSCLSAAPARAQNTAAGRGLTPEQIAASESLAPKFDQAAAREEARRKTFANRPLGGAIQRSFDVFSNYLVVAAEMMPESAYAFRPTPDVRTFGEQINHATGAHYSFCHQAGLPPGIQKQASPNLQAITTKADVVKALRDSITYCNSILAAATEAWLMETAPNLGGSSSGLIPAIRAHAFMYGNVHTAEDYGTITTYIRMSGMVPPSTALHPPARPQGSGK